MHAHDHGRARDRRLLAVALALILGLLAAEVAAGIVADSLALLADAGHMLTDAGALALALFAATIASRPAHGRWTFGYGRVEILAAQVNGITLLVVALWIIYGAVRRLISPPDVRGGIVLVIAVVGIVVNLAATAVLSRASRESLNVRGRSSTSRPTSSRSWARPSPERSSSQPGGIASTRSPGSASRR
jgi:cobalt-zinc-cadmium efflux system protein